MYNLKNKKKQWSVAFVIVSIKLQIYIYKYIFFPYICATYSANTFNFSIYI